MSDVGATSAEELAEKYQKLFQEFSRLNPSWLVGVGSSKKALEKSKVTLEVTKKLHKELYEVNGVYAQHVADLKAKIADLEKKTGELQELTRSHQASEEALRTINQEKNELDNELVETREELRSTQNLIEQHEQKLKEGDDVLRNEIDALRETLSINLGLGENQNDQFNALKDKIDPESNELIESFRHLQSSAREYLNSLKENSGSYELGLKVKNASQVWHQNLQKLAINLSNAQTEKEKLIKANENDSTKVETLEKEIIRLKEELENQKATANSLVGKSGAFTKMEECFDNDDDPPLLSGIFVYPIGTVKSTNIESSGQSTKELSLLSTVGTQTSVFRNGISLDHNIGRSAKSEDAANREQLIKKHYEAKIAQLQEMIQLSDSKSLRLYQSLKLMKEKLTESENAKSRTEQENQKLQHEISIMK
ncbi:21050_t:CDS:10, partial [Dentiscutata erythropus]